MGRKDSFSFEIDGLRDAIANCRNTAEWQHLSMAQKVRVLLEDAVKPSSNDEAGTQAIAFLKSLVEGRKPTNKEIALLAEAIETDGRKLIELRDKFCNGKGEHSNAHD
jgi:hypothetical protein